MQSPSLKTLIFCTIPFFGFFLGYVISNLLFNKTNVATPNIIGKSLDQGIRILSQNHLGVRLLRLQEDATLPEGTVCDQMPRPSQKIRPNQDIFVTLSTRCNSQIVPDFWGKAGTDAVEMVQQMGLELEQIFVDAAYPSNVCIAQIPSANQECDTKKLILYVSAAKQKMCVMPNFRGHLLSDVERELSSEDIRAEIFHIRSQRDDHICTNCKIVDQQPLPGAIVDMGKGLQFQFKVADF